MDPDKITEPAELFPLRSSDQIATDYNVGSRTILNWLYAGIIPAEFRVGKVIRFREKDVERALKRREKRRRGILTKDELAHLALSVVMPDVVPEPLWLGCLVPSDEQLRLVAETAAHIKEKMPRLETRVERMAFASGALSGGLVAEDGFPESSPSDEAPPLTSNQLAHKLNVSSRCVLNWLYDAIIPAKCRVNQTIRFLESEVIEALKSETARLHGFPNKQEIVHLALWAIAPDVVSDPSWILFRDPLPEELEMAGKTAAIFKEKLEELGSREERMNFATAAMCAAYVAERGFPEE